ncbi:MAG: hypothetical protein PHT19_00150 [Methylococcus sp.]|nr:hypothetical protein [Methylococcus sp.]
MYFANRPALSSVNKAIAAGAVCLLAACAHQTVETAAPSEAEICKSLGHVVSQADSDFKDIKLNVVVDPLANRWDTKPIFPGTDCDVLDWGGGRFTYNCVWQESDQTTARENYEENVKLAGRCLGKDWQASEQPGKTGKLSLFSKAGENTQIELRYFQERAPATKWQTSVTIGDRITPDAVK